MNKPHKHAEKIHAWADGSQIQRFSNEFDEWVDDRDPRWYIDEKYRIKPRIETRRYRVALLGTTAITVTNEDQAKLTESAPHFHSWLTDWIEYEVEVQP